MEEQDVIIKCKVYLGLPFLFVLQKKKESWVQG